MLELLEVQQFHTLWIKLEASEIYVNFNKEIPLRWAWGSALSWHEGGECGWGYGRAQESREARRMDRWMDRAGRGGELLFFCGQTPLGSPDAYCCRAQFPPGVII